MPNKPSYSQIVRNLRKDFWSNIKTLNSTIYYILHATKPVNLDIQIGNIKHIRNGAVVFGCSEPESENHCKYLQTETKKSGNFRPCSNIQELF